MKNQLKVIIYGSLSILWKTLENGKMLTSPTPKSWWIPVNISRPMLYFVDRFALMKGAILFKGDPLLNVELYMEYCRDCNYIFIDVDKNHGKRDEIFGKLQ